MNAFFKIGIVGFFMLMNVFGLMWLDFAVHDWKYFKPFNFGLFVNSFFYDYLKSGSFLSENDGNLYLGQCTHLQSIEGTCYEGQELVINDRYGYDIENYWFVDGMEEYRIPKVIALYIPPHHPKGHEMSLELRNYTLHKPTFSFEKMEQDGWQKMDVAFKLVDSLTNTGANELYFYYRDDQEGKKMSYKGTIRTYEIDARGFDLGQYRIMVNLEGHKALVKNVEVVPNLPVEWIIDGSDYINSESVGITIKNKSNYTMYYRTWDLPNRPRLRPDLTIYRNGKQTKIPFGGFGCGTGVYFQALGNGESIVCEDGLPLFWQMDIESEISPARIKQMYGDSVGVTYELLMVLPIWANYETQNIRSKEFIIKAEDLLENWKKKQKTKESKESNKHK